MRLRLPVAAGEGATDLLEAGEVAARHDALDGGAERAEPRGELGLARIDVVVEVVRRHQLVAGTVDEGGKVAQGVVRVRAAAVVDEVERRAQIAQQQPLADVVEDPRSLAVAGVGGRLGHDRVAEGVEVLDADPPGDVRPEAPLEARHQLVGGTDVVGQD